MKYLKTFENYSFNAPKYTRNGRDYFFETDNWSYRVGIFDNVNDVDFPYIGFRAKSIDDIDFNYDMSVITNDNVYQVMSTIKEILEYDYVNVNSDNKGYKFSFTGSVSKSNQRLKLYKRTFSGEWDIIYDDINNQYKLIRK